MNDTKRLFIKISAIISIIDSIGFLISGLILLSSIGDFGPVSTGSGYATNNFNLSKTGFILIGVAILALGIFALIGGILLLKNKNKAQLICGSIFTIIGAGVVSLAAIMLYIGLAISPEPSYYQESDSQVDRPSPSKPKEERVDDAKLKRQMEILRQMRANGDITNDEFKEMMFELIKKS